MNTPPPDQLDQELLAIARAITAPDSMPGRMMKVKRPNDSDPWDPDEDSRRSRAVLSQFQDNLEEAARMMASEPRP